jgi:hypothetical protein
VTFLVHILFVNAALGGAVTSALSLALLPVRSGHETAAFFSEVSTWAIALAITFGIAPLLFLQVLQGPVFYAATVLVARGWLALLVLLVVAYYLSYAAKHRFRGGGSPRLLVAANALLFLAIAAIQVAVHLLTVQPSRWNSALAHPWSILSDPSFVPRFLHFVLAGVSMAGLLLAWSAVRGAGTDLDEDARRRFRFGLTLAAVGTSAQLVTGFWLVGSLPSAVISSLMKGGARTMLPLTLGLLAGLGLLVVLLRVSDPARHRGLVRHAVELFCAATVLMVVTRHQVRGLTLAVEGAARRAAEAPQWLPIGVFLVAFVACVVLAVRSLLRAASRPAAGEPVA